MPAFLEQLAFEPGDGVGIKDGQPHKRRFCPPVARFPPAGLILSLQEMSVSLHSQRSETKENEMYSDAERFPAQFVLPVYHEPLLGASANADKRHP